MPVLKKKLDAEANDEWYIHIPNSGSGPPVYTIQVRDAGRDLLLDLDLDHDDAPNRAADIDWDTFQTLDALDLLYTKGTDYELGDAVPDNQITKTLDELTDKQRIEFADLLFERYTLDTLCSHSHIVQFLLSLQSLDRSRRHGVLQFLLEETPFDAAVVDTITDAFTTYTSASFANDDETPNPVAYALFARFAYEAIADASETYNDLLSSREGRPLWVWDDWVAFSGNELMFYSINETILAALPDALQTAARDEVEKVSRRYDNLLQGALSTLCKAQTVERMSEQNWQRARFAEAGVKHGVSYCLIVPRPSNHTQPIPGKAIAEADTPDESADHSEPSTDIDADSESILAQIRDNFDEELDSL